MYSIIDLHCDTLYALSKGTLAGTLLTNTLHVDSERMEKGGSITSCFALFVDTDEFSAPWQAASDLHDLFLSTLEKYGDRIRQVRTADDILNTATPSAILTCEEAQIIEGDLSRLGILRSWGVRLATLCWNHENDLCYPHTMVGMSLKDLGISVMGASIQSWSMQRNPYANHMRTKGESGILAIGPDFDGIGGKLAIADISGMEQLWDALSSAGFSQTELEGMWQKNALRVLSG